MELRGVCVVMGVLLLIHCSSQQGVPKKKPLKKEGMPSPLVPPQLDTWTQHRQHLPDKDPAIEELQKQINNILQEVNLLKERQALQTVCLRGFKAHGKCLLADPVKKNYHVAIEHCISLGGVLTTPQSATENNQLSDYVSQSLGSEEQVWLGVNDMAGEGDWRDQHRLSLLYKNWDASNYRSPQPNGDRSENCAALSADGGKWADENCRQEMASVCEFNIV